jgi:radical SAM superfamily enzyme YgiQ (UPF0313 family)
MMSAEIYTPDFLSFKNMIRHTISGDSLNYLIVMPATAVNNDSQYFFQIGIAYVSSALRLSGRNVWTLNLNYQENKYDVLKENIETYNIDVIATGGLSRDFKSIKQILDNSKKIKPNVITVVGGGIITSDPINAMMAFETADFGVCGEGEITICEFAHALEYNKNFSSVNGLVINNNGKWETTPSRNEIENLDILPWPDYDGFSASEIFGKASFAGFSDIDKERTLSISLGRSCPFNCTFCFHPSGNKYRRRTLDNFFDEIDYMVTKYNITALLITDELLFRKNNIDEAIEFCRRIEKYNIKWHAQMRVDDVSVDLIELMKSANCFLVLFGIESANDLILKSMRKGITVKQIEMALDICQKCKMPVEGFLIFGDIEETYETAMESINWWKNHRYIGLTWILVFPGTYIYKIACERNIIPDPVQHIKNECPEINISKMSIDERKQIAEIISNLTMDKYTKIENVLIENDKSGKVILRGKCPVCNMYHTFNNIEVIRPQIKKCSNCGACFNLNVFDYIDLNIFKSNIRRLHRNHKIAFWPCAAGIKNLTDNLPENCHPYFLDSSIFKQGTRINTSWGGGGYVIMSPDIIHEENIDTIILTISTNVIAQIVETIKHEYTSVKNILNVTDLIFMGECQ